MRKTGQEKVSDRAKLMPILRAGFLAGERGELIFPETLLESKRQSSKGIRMSKHAIQSQSVTEIQI